MSPETPCSSLDNLRNTLKCLVHFLHPHPYLNHNLTGTLPSPTLGGTSLLSHPCLTCLTPKRHPCNSQPIGLLGAPVIHLYFIVRSCASLLDAQLFSYRVTVDRCLAPPIRHGLHTAPMHRLHLVPSVESGHGLGI